MKTHGLVLAWMLMSPHLFSSEGEGEGVAVVELFTSQGCSSCPPADRLLAQLEGERRPGVYLLAFHVDYWDYLGWQDPFAKPAYTSRQRGYARDLGERVYTPQMIVNGHDVFVGSNRSQARLALNKALKVSADIKLVLTCKQGAAGGYNVAYQVEGELPKGALICLALVETGLSTRVRRGENSGRTLDGVNVVRSFVQQTAQADGQIALTLPQDTVESRASLIAFVQHKKSHRIIGAAATSLPRQK